MRQVSRGVLVRHSLRESASVRVARRRLLHLPHRRRQNLGPRLRPLPRLVLRLQSRDLLFVASIQVACALCSPPRNHSLSPHLRFPQRRGIRFVYGSPLSSRG